MTGKIARKGGLNTRNITPGDMAYLYAYPDYNINDNHKRRINRAADRVVEELSASDLDEVGVSEYNKQYLGKILLTHSNDLGKRAHPIALALGQFERPVEDLTIIDHGGGHGTISYLAAEIGFGTVIYNDIYGKSCQDVEKISSEVGFQIDHIVEGDMDDLLSYTEEKSLSPDLLVSYDVIEHIYDIERYFEQLNELASGRFAFGISSGANPCNPYNRRKITEKQRKVEYEDRKHTEGDKDRDTTQAYLSVRKNMIRGMTVDLSDTEVEKLAKRTRGQIESDIKRSVESYEETGKMPSEPEHPTNTCDPYTGNWCEHLMDPFELCNRLESYGFDSQVEMGWYRAGQQPVPIFLVTKLLNMTGWLASNVNKRWGVSLSPAYTLVGSTDDG